MKQIDNSPNFFEVSQGEKITVKIEAIGGVNNTAVFVMSPPAEELNEPLTWAFTVTVGAGQFHFSSVRCDFRGVSDANKNKAMFKVSLFSDQNNNKVFNGPTIKMTDPESTWRQAIFFRCA